MTKKKTSRQAARMKLMAIVFGVVVVGLFLALFVANKNQDSRSDAAGAGHIVCYRKVNGCQRVDLWGVSCSNYGLYSNSSCR